MRTTIMPTLLGLCCLAAFTPATAAPKLWSQVGQLTLPDAPPGPIGDPALSTSPSIPDVTKHTSELAMLSGTVNGSDYLLKAQTDYGINRAYAGLTVGTGDPSIIDGTTTAMAVSAWSDEFVFAPLAGDARVSVQVHAGKSSTAATPSSPITLVPLTFFLVKSVQPFGGSSEELASILAAGIGLPMSFSAFDIVSDPGAAPAPGFEIIAGAILGAVPDTALSNEPPPHLPPESRWSTATPWTSP